MDGCKGLCGIFANQSINCVIRQIVRNYGARNNLKSMKRGDFAFFYHRFVCPPKSRYHKNEEEKKKKKRSRCTALFTLFIYSCFSKMDLLIISKGREETVVFRG